MNAWLHLTKKEFRMGFPAIIISLATFAAAQGIGLYFGLKYDTAWIVAGIIALVFAGLHHFFIPLYMLFSLNAEKKRLHLWLHNPMPAYKLLLAKFTAAVGTMIPPLLIISIVAWIGSTQFPIIGEEITRGDVTKIGIIAFLQLIITGLDISMYFLLVYLAYLFLTRYMHGFLSGLIVFIGAVVLAILYGRFSLSDFFAAITEWGPIEISGILQSFQFSGTFGSGLVEMAAQEGVSIYIGSFVVEFVIVIILFLIASWLIDRRIEV